MMEARGKLGEANLSTYARDEDLARKLWELSEGWTGVSFDLSS